MSDTDTKTIENKNNNSWFDNLLIKDKKGKLFYYKKQGSDKPALVLEDSKNPAPVKMPLLDGKPQLVDHNFVQDDYAKLRAKADSPADFYFHPDDQKDLEGLASKMFKDDSKKYGIEKIVARLMEKQSINFDQDNKKLFTSALFNFFRNRKDAVTTREVLSQKITLNNKKLPDLTVDVIMSIVKGIKAKIEAAGGLVVEEEEIKLATLTQDAKVELKPIVLDDSPIEEPQKEIDKALIEIAKVEEKPEPEVLEKKEPLPIKDETEKEKPKEPEIILPVVAKETPISFSGDAQKVEVKLNSIPQKNDDFSIPPEKAGAGALEDKKTEADIYLPKVNRPSANPLAKKQLSDVVAKQTSGITSASLKSNRTPLTGPIQELQTMDLVAFRRLGKTAQERANKVFDRLSLLEQDSFTKKAQGIQAWRGSNIYRLYLQLGSDSMSQGKQIGDLLNEYSAQGKDTLDIDEFSAISDLNKKIRF